MMPQSTQNKKLIITNEMLSVYPKDSGYDLRIAFIKWWINSRQNGGLRLTSTGYKVLQTLQYETYHFTAKKLSTPANLITMDKYLECPYYINGLGCVQSSIIIFGGPEATMINLYENFNEFLRVLKN
jgi:hypothetical protein